MSDAKQVQINKNPDYKLRPGFTESELERFQAFLKRTGRGQRSAGPFARFAILRAMDAETTMGRGVAALLPDHPEAS